MLFGPQHNIYLKYVDSEGGKWSLNLRHVISQNNAMTIRELILGFLQLFLGQFYVFGTHFSLSFPRVIPRHQVLGKLA